jgi:hypothetical protein
MSTIHFHQTTTSTPELFGAGITGFGVLGVESVGVLRKAFDGGV